MSKAISNTSPLLYLYRIEAIDWLPKLFDEVWTPDAVKNELLAGRSKGYDVPDASDYPWLNIINPKSMPSEWLALDLGAGELQQWHWRWKIQHTLFCLMMDWHVAQRRQQVCKFGEL